MVSTFSANKRLEEPANGDYTDTWDIPVNANMTAIDTALGGSTLLNATGLGGGVNILLTDTQYRPLSLLGSGLPIAGGVVYCIPTGVGGQWVFQNATTGGFPVAFRSNAGGPILTVAAGTSTLMSCDGSASGMRYSVTSSAVAAGSSTQVQYNTGGSLAASANLTFDGTALRAAGLNVAGNSTIGANAASTISITGTAVAIPNGLNIGANKLFVSGTAAKVGIGTTTVGTNALTVVGVVQSTSGGFKFPDNSVQTTAAGTGGAAGSNTWVQYNNAGAFGGDSAFTFVAGSGVLTVPSVVLSATPLAVTSGGTGVTTSTGSGATVRGTSPTLATPTISSPTLTGVPVAPTAAVGTNTTQVATAALVLASTGQSVTSQPGTLITVTGTIPYTDAIPDNTQGTEVLSRAITPKSATSVLKVDVVITGASNAVDIITAALFRDSTFGAVAAAGAFFPAGTVGDTWSFSYSVVAGSTSATTFKVRVGANSGGDFYVNGASAARILGGVAASSITVTELSPA